MDKYEIVKKQIDKMDCYGLLSGGAPDDEFDSEAKEIAERIEITMSAEEISEIIADVFNRSFNERDKSEHFMNVAEAIANNFIDIYIDLP